MPSTRPPARDPEAGDSDVSYGADYDANGVDLTLLRERLRLTPLDRLKRMEEHAAEVQALNEYGRRHREAKAASDR